MAHDVVSPLRPAWTAPVSARRTVTPIYGAHRAFGARFGQYAGITLPMRYAGEIVEASAARSTVGLFDLSYLGEISVTGRDAAAMLDHALTGRISSLEIGQARRTFLCAEDGGILHDLAVSRVDAAEYLVIGNSLGVEPLLDELSARGERFAARVDDRSEDYAAVSVEGPRAAAVLGSLTPADPRALHYLESVETTVAGRNGMLARTGFTSDFALEFYCAPDDATAVWYALAEAGIPHEIQPVGLLARGILRIEAGVPLIGRELTPDVSPYDARLGVFVDLTKPEFVGRAALAERAASPGSRTLIGLLAEGRRPPRPGQPVLDALTGDRLGTVTSGAFSPTVGRCLAMAYVSVDALAEEATLAVEPAPGELLTVVPAVMPFYSEHRVRASVPR
jgi:aminomethyltransferase